MFQHLATGNHCRYRTTFLLLTTVTTILMVPYMYVTQHIYQPRYTSSFTFMIFSTNNNSAGSRRLSTNKTMTSLRAPSQEIVCDAKCQWKRLQVSRKEHLRRECARFNEKPADNLTHWLQKHRQLLPFVWFSDSHKALYCSVAKSGSSKWKKVFYMMNKMDYENSTKVDLSQIDDIHAFTQHSPWRLSKLKSIDGIIHRLTTYSSFIFVREPFTRIVSAFKDKFENNGKTELWRQWSQRIQNHLGIINTTEAISFDDLINYASDPEIKGTHYGADKHWLPMNEKCFPCQIHYDIIGKLETMDDDVHNTLEHFQVPELMNIVTARPGHQTNSSDKIYVQKYLSKLSGQQIDKFVQRYERDFKMFGYSTDLIGSYKHDIGN